MLSRFDWIRRSRSWAELVASLQYMEAQPALGRDGSAAERAVSSEGLGPPSSALTGPGLRCWIYPHITTQPQARYCETCQSILNTSRQLSTLSRYAVVVWG